MTSGKKKHEAILLSFKEVLCDIKSHSVGSTQPNDRYPNDGYMIEVTNDGKIFSKAQIYIIYDSKCMECKRKIPSCTQKDKTCIISGHCSLHGEKIGNEICDKKVTNDNSTSTFSLAQIIFIAVGCIVGVALLIATRYLVRIRRRQRKNRMKRNVNNESNGAMELRERSAPSCNRNFENKLAALQVTEKMTLNKIEGDNVLQVSVEKKVTLAIVNQCYEESEET